MHRLTLLIPLVVLSCSGKDGADSVGDDSAPPARVDADQDGFYEDEDCDDTNAAVNPEADEVCNDIDDNCDQAVDTDAVDQGTWYTDADHDGWGDPATETTACEAGDDQVDNDEDCDDTTELRGPTVLETCNDVDDDCDGRVDEQATDESTWYPDADGDGWGDDAGAVEACDAPTGTEVLQGGDCDDGSPTVNPSATEVCDGADNDCDAATPEAGVWHEADGVWSDWSAASAAGVVGAPVALTVPSGTLHVCDGTWYVNVEATGSATLAGHGTSDDPALDAGGVGSVVAVWTDGVDLAIEGLTLSGGVGSVVEALGSSVSGGGVLCAAAGGSTVSLTDTTILGNEARLGAGVALVDCDLVATRTSLESNTGDYGGALFVHGDVVGAAVSFTDSFILGNVASTTGGGIDVEALAPVLVDLVDTSVSGNGAYFGGGAALLYDVTATCSGSSATRGGFQGNSGTLGGAVLMYPAGFASTFTSTECDFGDPETADDNTPEDLYLYDSDAEYTFGDDASFTCDSLECL